MRTNVASHFSCLSIKLSCDRTRNFLFDLVTGKCSLLRACCMLFVRFITQRQNCTPIGDGSNDRSRDIVHELTHKTHMTIKTTLLTRILSCLAAIVAAGFCATSMAAPVAYVPNEKSGTISVIDTETDSVVAEIKAGDKPRGLVGILETLGC